MSILIIFNEKGNINICESKKPGNKQLNQLYKLIDAEYVEPLPILNLLVEKEMILYSDETGVLKRKALNPLVKNLIPPRTYHFLNQYGSPAGTCVLEVQDREDLDSVLELYEDDKIIYKRLKKALAEYEKDKKLGEQVRAFFKGY